ncbi:MAG: Gfo/Idh/MocA family oxidoreductase [Lachnospiraceae bacterium]|nr:Gfo/Idh/MocA family oxidoreductase [Lachnospiraceae bacterium]
MKIGILSASDIAKRRFLPALMKCDAFEPGGIGLADDEERRAATGAGGILTPGKRAKAMELCDGYGVRLYESYHELLTDEDIEAVYISLPPALHSYWCMEALKAGKHVLVEKPAATKYEDCEKMLALAEEKGLAVAENYGFLYHRQMKMIKKLVRGGEIGQVRLIRAAFGFPRRREDDFRYAKALGGGALLDCGGYTLRLAGELLGKDMELKAALLMPLEGHDVDGHGYITAVSGGGSGNSADDGGLPVNVTGSGGDNGDMAVAAGAAAQLSFGMDNQYKCELEIWGSAGTIFTDRIFTAPPELETKVMLTKGLSKKEISAGADDQFLKIIEVFASCIEDQAQRDGMREKILWHNMNLGAAFALAAEK